MSENTWTAPMAVWVSRKASDDLIYRATVPMWLWMILFLLILTNVLAWGIIGLVEVVEYIA